MTLSAVTLKPADVCIGIGNFKLYCSSRGRVVKIHPRHKGENGQSFFLPGPVNYSALMDDIFNMGVYRGTVFGTYMLASVFSPGGFHFHFID